MNNEIKNLDTSAFKRSAAPRLIKSRRTGTSHCSSNIERQRRAATPYSSAFCLLPSVFSRKSRRAGFSLAEILIAIFVLSIGLIMIAGVFPVAAKWTAEDAQTSVAQVIAKNAVAQIEAQYAGSPANVPATVLGGTNGYGPFVYSFGNAQPFQFGTHQAVTATNYAPFPLDPAPAAPTPAPVPPPGSYYWSALMLPAASTYAGSSGVYPGAQNKGIYTLYIFVFNKGDTNNVFPTPPPPYTGSGPVPMAVPQDGYPESFYPQIYEGYMGSIVTASPTGLPMPIGSLGVDVTTGQVFREIVDPTTNALTITGIPESSTSPNPYLRTGDTIIFAPAAAGQTASPLVYVYVTTVNL